MEEKELMSELMSRLLPEAKEAMENYAKEKSDLNWGHFFAFYKILSMIQYVLILWNPSDTDAEYVEALKSYGFDIDVDAYLATEFKPLTHIFKNYPHRGE